MIKNSLILIILLFLTGCHTNKTLISNQNRGVVSQKNRTSIHAYHAGVKEYIDMYKTIAMNNMRDYGIPSSIILAQGILESGAGKGNLAVTANNHFGIKCHKDWRGESVRQDDDAAQECFRKYDNPAESFRDHALFLTNRNRYASLFELPKEDYESWAKGLRAAGYATDPNYPQKLISYIENYELYQYDNQVLGKKYKKNNPTLISENQNAADYEVKQGDTLYSISKQFNLDLETLKQRNNLIDNTLYVGQKLQLK